MLPSNQRRRGLITLIAPLCSLAVAATARAQPQPSTRPARADNSPFVFRDAGDDSGLFPGVAGVRGHAAAWGDADGDGFPDLFVGTFHEAGSKPSLFFRNSAGHFRLDEQKALQLDSCASGAIFVDLTNSGRLDLYVNNNAHGAEGAKAAPANLFRNDGGGKFTDVSAGSGACPPGFEGRTVAALDFDGDGLLDLLACDFYYSTKSAKGIALYHNLGNYHFEDVAERVGLPRGRAISGCAVADLNGDGWPDLLLVGADGDNRLYLNDAHGHFTEAPGTREVLWWKGLTAENSPTGVCIADVNRDGLPDIVIGHHFKQPWLKPAPVRLYLNRGTKDGRLTFEDVTEASGLGPLAMKAPHVEFQDFDNDGWPDLFLSIVKFKDGKPYPLVYKNLGPQGGAHGGVPRFREDAWAVNDFPTAGDKASRRTTDFFKKMVDEKKVMYTAAAPTADYDRDGRIDIFMPNWWAESRSLLLHNETPGGNWLQVQVQGDPAANGAAAGTNRMGVGSRIRVYPAGKMGDAAVLLGDREIAVGYGWCSGQEAVAHFGLGEEKSVDVEVTLPHGKGKLLRPAVKANQRLTVQPSKP